MTYGQQQPGYPPAGPQLGVGPALSFAWDKFKNNALVWVAIVLVAFLIQIAINLIFGSNTEIDDDGVLSVGFGIWQFLGTVVSTIVGYLISAALVRGALHETDGTKPGFGSFFQFTRVGTVILAGLLVGLATGIGLLLCILPGLVIAFFTWWTMQFVIDRDQDAVSAIKSSFTAISGNAGPLLLLALALFGINVVGALLCGVGLLVTVPLTIIASTYAYRVVTGGTVVGAATGTVPEPGYPQYGGFGEQPGYGAPGQGYGGPAGGPGYGEPGYGGPAGGYEGPAGGPGYGGSAGQPGYGGPTGEPGYGGPAGGSGYGGPPASGPGTGGPGYGATPAGGPGQGDPGYPGASGPGTPDPDDSGPDLGKPGPDLGKPGDDQR